VSWKASFCATLFTFFSSRFRFSLRENYRYAGTSRSLFMEASPALEMRQAKGGGVLSDFFRLKTSSSSASEEALTKPPQRELLPFCCPNRNPEWMRGTR